MAQSSKYAPGVELKGPACIGDHGDFAVVAEVVIVEHHLIGRQFYLLDGTYLGTIQPSNQREIANARGSND